MRPLPNKKYRRLLDDLDERLSYHDPAAQAAVVLVAASNVGTDPEAVAKETGLPIRLCGRIAKQARDGGVFTSEGKIAHSGWFDKETGGVAFWLDVCVVNGLLQRVPE